MKTQKIYEEKEKKLKSSSNKFLYSFLIVFVAGYAMFFSSRLWLPKTYEGVEPTPIGETVQANNRNVTIDSWIYSPDQKAMQVIIEIENLSIDGIDEYAFSVRDAKGRIRSELIASDNEFFILNIYGIRKDWTELALNIDLPDELKSKNKEFVTITIYTNDKVVTDLQTIEEQTDISSYKKIAYKSKIDKFTEEQKKAEKEIKELQKKIDNSNTKIEELQEKAKKQTKNEQADTLTTIESLQSEQSNLESSLTDKETYIEELQEKIDYQKKLLKEIE